MEIRRVACIGAGLIGQGWATLFASKGLEVTLQDLSELHLGGAIQGVASNLRFLEANSLVRVGEADAALGRVRTTTDLGDAVDRADYVQESAFDDYDLKKELFRQMDARAPSHTVLASSSSGLRMTEIQKATTKPGRCVLVHPMLPVHLMPLVEIVGGDQTSRETVQITRTWLEGLGKTAIVLHREVPGYIVNRLQAALLREAIDLVDQGVASAEDVDRAFCKGIGLRDPFIGPLLRIHLAGGGIERFIENFAQSYRYRWETMETWTSIPASAAERIIRGVKDMAMVQSMTLEAIQTWRDEMLVKLLRIIGEA